MIIRVSTSGLHAGAIHLLLDASLFEETPLLSLYEARDEHIKLVQHGDGDIGSRLVGARIYHMLILLGEHVHRPCQQRNIGVRR